MIEDSRESGKVWFSICSHLIGNKINAIILKAAGLFYLYFHSTTESNLQTGGSKTKPSCIEMVIPGYFSETPSKSKFQHVHPLFISKNRELYAKLHA
jgi:hypothetical protein